MLTILLLVLTGALARWLIGRRREWSRLALVAGAVVCLALLLTAAALNPGAYEMGKLAGTLAMPAGLVWLALGGLAWSLAEAGRRRWALAAAACFIAYAAAGNAWLGNALTRLLEAPYRTVDPFLGEPLDAAVVLGGGLDVTEQGQVTLGDAGDRVILALRLQRAGRVHTLVTTGPHFRHPVPHDVTVPAATAALWRELGVPADAIVAVPGPRNTSEEIAAFARLVRERRWRRVGVVTSAWHLRRAMRLARRAGLEPAPLPADVRSQTTPFLPRYLVPQGDGFAWVNRGCWELLGAAVGR